MRAFLMSPDADFSSDQQMSPESEDLVSDLGLDRLFDAMAGGDKFVRQVAKAAVLSPVPSAATVIWRQQALSDCLAHPDRVSQLYNVAIEALDAHRRVTFFSFNRSPESLMYSSLQSLGQLCNSLRKLRHLAGQYAPDLGSPAFRRLFSSVLQELDETYLKALEGELKELKFPRGVMMSATLGRANKGAHYVLRKPAVTTLRGRLSRSGARSYSFTVAERDEAGLRALSDLRAKGLNQVANALAQSTEHVVGFFAALRTELAFYLGCLNLERILRAKGEPTCTPRIIDGPGFSTKGLYDPSLSLGLEGQAVGNDVDAGAKELVVVTGANRGGKSTFLRSLGIAQLMMQAGMFVAAEAFSASLCPGVFTHFKRNEDPAMRGGKLEEELARMGKILQELTPGCLLLCNEPFASTNEREGSEIGRQVFLPLVDEGVRVALVTHLFDLADSLHEMGIEQAIFLRAPRQLGALPFRLVVGPPEPTAYGEDVYKRVFGEPPA